MHPRERQASIGLELSRHHGGGCLHCISVASGSGRGMSVLALVHGGALKFVPLREFHNDGVVLFDGAEREKASSRGVGPAGCLARAWELGRRGERETGRRGRFPDWRAGWPIKKHVLF